MEFFEHLLTLKKRVQSSFSEITQRETSQKVDEQPSSQEVYEQPNEQRSTKVRRAKTLGSDEIDSQRIFFYLVKDNRDKIVRTIPIILQVEDDPKTYKEVMASSDATF